MGQRQVEQHRVVRDRELLDVVDAAGHLVVVAVPDHAGLRRPGRARGVDEGEEVVLADLRLGLGERAGMGGSMLPAVCTQCVQLGERDHVSKPDVGDLGPLLFVLDEHADRVRVLEDVAAVLRRAVRVDRRADRADPCQREVEERPLERRLREDPERVALAHAARQQAVRDLVHRARRLAPADLAPAVGALDEVRRIRPRRLDRFAPELTDRSAHDLSLFREGMHAEAAKLPGPTTLIHRRKRPHANYLERIPQFWPSDDPGRARAGDDAEGALV